MSGTRRLCSLLLVILICPAIAAQDSDPPTAEVPANAAITPPQVIIKTQKAPVFPPAAKAARFTGTVTVKASIRKDGSVGEVKVIECTHPNVGFEQASVEAVKQWKFEPARNNGDPVEYATQFRLNFRRAGRESSTFVTSGPFEEIPSSDSARKTPGSGVGRN